LAIVGIELAAKILFRSKGASEKLRWRKKLDTTSRTATNDGHQIAYLKNDELSPICVGLLRGCQRRLTLA